MMKKYAVLALVALGLVACGSDDDNGTEPATQHELVGNWLSTGTDVALGLRAGFKTKQIVATFNANNTYTVTATDSANANVIYTGTWSAPTGANGTIRAITLNQATPTQVTSTGIFQITTPATGAKTMKYEVIQTTPAIQGFNAPTVTGGFGSTTYNGTPLGTYWVQGFVKQ